MSQGLTKDELYMLADELAREYFAGGAQEAWQLIDAEDPKIKGTILEIELRNLRWLLNDGIDIEYLA